MILKTTVVKSDTTETYNWLPYVLTIPGGDYDGYRLATGIQDLLNSIEFNFTFDVKYNAATGTIKIEETSEGGSNTFGIPSDYGITDWFNNHSEYSWRNIDNIFLYTQVILIFNLLMVYGENTEMTPVRLSYMYDTYESGFLDLLNIHNIYKHCQDLGHFNSIGVRGGSTIIQKVTVSSSFVYLIIDSVVSPHDKVDVSRQTVKTIHITLKSVSGNVINLHGANCSFSLVFVTSE